MARRLVICLDGTGNEIGRNLSNVLKLYRVLRKTGDQLVYYNPGVGTVGQPSWWAPVRRFMNEWLGLALGVGLDDNLLDAYSWLCRTYEDGDDIYLFGFSRGAYTARTLAGFIHLCGLLRAEQLNLCGYALVAYKKSGDEGDFSIGETFRRVSGARRVTLPFVGVWDTVSSVLVPRARTLFIPTKQTLPFTRTNPSVRAFRHAISIDERRRMFRLNHWKDPQDFKPDPFDRSQDVPQDIRQVWFAGVHADVGGGYPDEQSGLAQFPLLWMIEQAVGAGLDVDDELVHHLARGAEGKGGSIHRYPLPNPAAELHKSLAGPWWLLEPIPQRVREQEWPRRTRFLGLYIPWAEPRPIPNRVWKGKPPDEPFYVHHSVVERIAKVEGYRPVNLPETFATEPPDFPRPPIPPPPYRGPGLLARLAALFRTWPSGSGWLGLVRNALWLLPLLGLLGWWGGFLAWDPRFDRELLLVAAVALIFPALVEETIFRGALLKPPSDGATGLGPAALSAILFALWHPLQKWFYGALDLPAPGWAAYAGDWTFLLAAAALGLACARLVLATRSIWPAVALHWLVVVAWKALFGGPGLPV